jgi:hypothetical protein
LNSSDIYIYIYNIYIYIYIIYIYETLNRLAASYRYVGRHADALDMFEQVLAFRRRVLPADHPYIVDSMVNLAVSYHNAGRHAEASLLHKQVILFRPPNFSR